MSPSAVVTQLKDCECPRASESRVSVTAAGRRRRRDARAGPPGPAAVATAGS